jgi:tetratricopeptide (TPR) repeat protein
MPPPVAQQIVTRTYKSGSIIYFEGDKSEYIYILKGGRVILTSIKLDSNEEVKEDVRPGEFFGVKSAVGRYPREETAQSIGDTVVLALPIPEFERLIIKNVNVVRKMLRVFSNQLRKIHKTVRSVMGEEDSINAEAELFKIGEYYYKEGVFKHAQYAFKKYVDYYPDMPDSDTARQRLKAIASGNANADDVRVSPPPSARVHVDENELDDFKLDDDEPAPSSSSEPEPFQDFGGDSDFQGTKSELTNEMDDFLADDGSSHGSSDVEDDFSFDAPAAKNESVTDIYEDANRLYTKEKYADAIQRYDQVLINEDPFNAGLKSLFAKSRLEMGICQLMLGKSKESIEIFSNLIKNYPDSETIKSAYYHIGMIYEKANQKDKALGFYSKALNMSPKDKINENAMNKIKQLQKG